MDKIKSFNVSKGRGTHLFYFPFRRLRRHLREFLVTIEYVPLNHVREIEVGYEAVGKSGLRLRAGRETVLGEKEEEKG